MAKPVLDSARTFVGVREVRREFPLPDEVMDEVRYTLRNTAPQALLRDLHRPVTRFEVSILDFERHEIPRDAGRDAYAAVKEQVLRDYRVPIETLVTTNGDARTAYRELKRRLAEPWKIVRRANTRVTGGDG